MTNPSDEAAVLDIIESQKARLARLNRYVRRLRRHIEQLVAALVPHDRGPTH